MCLAAETGEAAVEGLQSAEAARQRTVGAADAFAGHGHGDGDRDAGRGDRDRGGGHLAGGQSVAGVRIAAMSNCRRTFSLTIAPPSASRAL